MHSYGANQPALAGFGVVSSLPVALCCELRGVSTDSAVALMEYATLMAHVRALEFAAALVLITNLAIVALLLALRYDQLWAPRLAARMPL